MSVASPGGRQAPDRAGGEGHARSKRRARSLAQRRAETTRARRRLHSPIASASEPATANTTATSVTPLPWSGDRPKMRSMKSMSRDFCAARRRPSSVHAVAQRRRYRRLDRVILASPALAAGLRCSKQFDPNSSAGHCDPCGPPWPLVLVPPTLPPEEK